jgi:hypothetical protein
LKRCNFTTVVIQYYNQYAVLFITPPPPHQATSKIIFQKDKKIGRGRRERKGDRIYKRLVRIVIKKCKYMKLSF